MPIIRRQALETVLEELSEPRAMSSLCLAHLNAIIIAKSVNILSLSLLMEQVTALQARLRIIKHRSDLGDRKGVVTAIVIAKTQPEILFVEKIAKLSGKK